MESSPPPKLDLKHYFTFLLKTLFALCAVLRKNLSLICSSTAFLLEWLGDLLFGRLTLLLGLLFLILTGSKAS